MEQNKIDGGKRQFIIVTNNENNIATETTLQRMKNVMIGYQETRNVTETLFELPINLSILKNNYTLLDAIEKYNGDNYKKLYNEIKLELKNNKFKILGTIEKKHRIPGSGNNLKYYKTDFIGKSNVFNASDEDKVELAHNAGELLAIAENTLETIEQTEYYQLFEDNLKKKYTAVYFREELDQFENFVEIVEKLNNKIAVYVFSWGDNEFTEEFEHIRDIKVKTIPIPILEIYKNIYNLE
jgi:hypothetical protein